MKKNVNYKILLQQFVLLKYLKVRRLLAILRGPHRTPWTSLNTPGLIRSTEIVVNSPISAGRRQVM